MFNSMYAARAEISELALSLWNQISEQIYGSPAKTLWNSIPEQEKTPNNDKAFARVVIRHIKQGQSSLADNTGLIKWKRQGIITIQCFAPITLGNSFNNAETLSTFLRDGFQRAPGCVWYRNCAAFEVGPNNGWYQFNMTADFEYDEVK